MDENSVSSQIFLILLSVITPLVQNVQLNFCIQAMSKQYSDVCCFLLFFGGGGWGEHAQKPKFGDSRFLSEKKPHKALRSIQFLASFISFYFEILSYLACGVKKIRLASKSSVKLNEKSTSDF